ncbi:NADPH:quinone reductase [Virgisporangium aliadipatigenens]|uniref:NADPH:quinone reductase n=1 Tax=Virgisporangium aliadipatigenens TaxID=741659 RepID=A0A8J3YE34_9ACTN|nr:NADP-dependent oxidoreductase [Virgisporangium aliadipatigenens]GIJ43306.1 NADPH:quinone reductase [Virgisporangium aliadipatigenens]
MRAVVFREYGSPDVLRVEDVDTPEPGPGQVRLRVRAAGVNRFDCKVRAGAFRAALPRTPGFEVAGVVDAVGAGVTGLAVGDEVFGFADSGGYAEYALATVVAPKPAGLGWDEAVALPNAGETAQRVLGLLGLEAGETLLVHGASGAVGGVAVQLAAVRGATVIGTASPANHDYLRSLGVVPVAYGDHLVERVHALAPHGIDAVFDTAGKGALPDSIALRGGRTERIVTIADGAAAEELGVTASFKAERSVDGLAELARLAVEGKLRVEVARVFALDEAPAAHAQAETGHTRGKLVLRP